MLVKVVNRSKEDIIMSERVMALMDNNTAYL